MGGSGYSANQDFGDLDGVQGGAFATIFRHDPLDTIHRDTISEATVFTLQSQNKRAENNG